MTPAGNDQHVKLKLLRWGNWDSVTNAIRWCGNSFNTGWSTTCNSTSEVPTTLSFAPNTVPSSETVPTSYYLSAKPAWFGSVTWPPIGPEVTGGNISGFAGHANKIPARLCYEATANDTDYAISPAIKNFNSLTCYGS